MFDKIIAYSIKNKFVIALLTLVLIGAGLYSLKKLPIDALPDITNNQVQIITTSPSLSTKDVELFITYPIEMAVKSIPEIVELRSISRFGLSVVTVVFKESTDLYWARNLITERLREAEENIPEHYGKPMLAPISTGLGEIYQYTVAAANGFEDKYNAMDLRSMQDWLIAPQLLGTPGVAEVNTLGGKLKEYEVAVDPNVLKGMELSMLDIYDAITMNNENAGGAYIDKKPYAYYIRSVGVITSLEELRKVVVTTRNGIPILVGDVAEVGFGNPVRYGATTKNGKGEVISGMVMMLKGANSAEVVADVKDKIEAIKKTLPEGVVIEPFLDRTKLVDKAISTVTTNLLEGALIVIFILILLIGNLRAGLIVASVIPLALLFAVCMMSAFGVSGNLMSLGAIDFGLIVDGAVIIVEAIVHQIYSRKEAVQLSRSEMDEEVYAASSKIRTSAAFGEIIILIVYLPILALVGIEGKMFMPMAQTVSFAILGAFILSLTYVPMMSAAFLSRNINPKTTISDRIIRFFHRLYEPVLLVSLRFKKTIILLTLLLTAGAAYLFLQLGGEFIPVLSEGDIASHIIIPPGSSLEQEIYMTTASEKLILENFPEVEQVVSKIGSAEVPTDPMPMEVADMMVILKDKKEWTSAKTLTEMYKKMEVVLNDLPGVTTEFTQPIQMRFNELMTGIRSDVGVKIFGDDLERLIATSEQIEGILNTISGVVDARAETVFGLQQLNIRYDKNKIALYGLNISDINKLITMGFSGLAAGHVYEAEKRYNVVVRLNKDSRNSIEDVKALNVELPSGGQIPLGQLADIKLERESAQISREQGKRRIIVGFNVRDRDVESVVDELQARIDNEVNLPIGYYTEFAGQFENLKAAKQRLSIAVPVALFLIFTLLFMTFGNIKQCLLIFTAIPLSAIGGVTALWLRDMPFSISAGIGFIALFGVAVLNGIVLIGYFNQLKEEGITDIIERIKLGTEVRLRPVIMTASVASLGFLPMALSNSAGAEVQKPLATVVIGGLITATLLTLILLPILYYYSEKLGKMNIGNLKSSSMIFLLLLGFAHMNGQVTTLEEAYNLMETNSGQIQIAKSKIDRAKVLSEGTYIFPKAEIEGNFGQINSIGFDQSYGISQSFNIYEQRASKSLGNAQSKILDSRIQTIVAEGKYKVQGLWDQLEFLGAKSREISQQQADWTEYIRLVKLRAQYGEEAQTKAQLAEASAQQLELKLMEINYEKTFVECSLKQLLRTELDITPKQTAYQLLRLPKSDNNQQFEAHPKVLEARQQVELIKAQQQVNTAARKPDFMLGYEVQSFNGQMNVNGQVREFNAIPRFQVAKVGVAVPLFKKGYSAKEKLLEKEMVVNQEVASNIQTEMTFTSVKLKEEVKALVKKIEYIETKQIPLINDLIEKSNQLFKSGETSNLEHLQALNLLAEVQLDYLKTIHQHNQIILKLNYLIQ